MQPGKNNGSVLVVQRALARAVGLDFSSGPGNFGPRTTRAYAAWQRRCKLRANGRPEVEVVEDARRQVQVQGAEPCASGSPPPAGGRSRNRTRTKCVLRTRQLGRWTSHRVNSHHPRLVSTACGVDHDVVPVGGRDRWERTSSERRCHRIATVSERRVSNSGRRNVGREGSGRRRLGFGASKPSRRY